METWEVTILGEPASKANSRRLVSIRGKPRFIKSQKALSYVRDFGRQVASKRPAEPLGGNLSVEVRIWYKSRRPDLDPSLIFDLLQSEGVIVNDRQIKEIHATWGLDRENPRASILLKPLCDDFGLPS